jgi:fructose-bisphosphate aldolase class II
MEIGITGGEEDGVNNEDVDNNSLYTQPEDIYDIYKELSSVSQYFSIAAGFGNVHGVYKPGNVKLRPELLQKHQQFVKEKTNAKDDKPVFLVFHGGSGSSVDDFRQAISYGVVKVNLDTDMQWAYLSGVRDYVLNKKDYLMTQVGNPDGEDKPVSDRVPTACETYTNPRLEQEVLRPPCLGTRGREDYVSAPQGRPRRLLHRR